MLLFDNIKVGKHYELLDTVTNALYIVKAVWKMSRKMSVPVSESTLIKRSPPPFLESREGQIEFLAVSDPDKRRFLYADNDISSFVITRLIPDNEVVLECL